VQTPSQDTHPTGEGIDTEWHGTSERQSEARADTGRRLLINHANTETV
jgi:hypothetical protein